MSKHYVGEIGTDLLFDVGAALDTITAQHIIWKDAVGVVGTWAGTLYSSYSTEASAIGTYFVKYTLAAGDFNVAGDWEFQAMVATTVGSWYGENVKLHVLGTFE